MREFYDVFAHAYNKFWGQITENQFQIMDELVLENLDKGAHILDVCCGTGTIAKLLLKKGFTVDGIDLSPEMIDYARINASGATFTVGDATCFTYDYSFDLVVSTLDSFCTFLDSNDLKRVFMSVYKALKKNGIFYFEMRNKYGYENYFDKSCISLIADDVVGAIETQYDSADRIGLMKCAYFTPEENGLWRRRDISAS